MARFESYFGMELNKQHDCEDLWSCLKICIEKIVDKKGIEYRGDDMEQVLRDTYDDHGNYADIVLFDELYLNRTDQEHVFTYNGITFYLYDDLVVLKKTLAYKNNKNVIIGRPFRCVFMIYLHNEVEFKSSELFEILEWLESLHKQGRIESPIFQRVTDCCEQL